MAPNTKESGATTKGTAKVAQPTHMAPSTKGNGSTANTMGKVVGPIQMDPLITTDNGKTATVSITDGVNARCVMLFFL